MRLEQEAMSDISMLPDTSEALARQWRSFDRDGSALGALINVGWLILAACLALLAERAAGWGLSVPVRRRMRLRVGGPTLAGLLALAAVSGLADVDAITLSSLRLFDTGALSAQMAAYTIGCAFAGATAFKLAVVAWVGGRGLHRRVACPGRCVLRRSPQPRRRCRVGTDGQHA